jgi:hypothetical protein
MFMFEGGAKSKAQQARAARVQERRARVTRPQGAPDVQALQTVRNMLETIVPRGQVSSVSHPTQPTTPAAGDVQDIEVDETSFPLPEEDDTSYLTPGGAIDIDVEESPSSQIRQTPQDTVDAEAEAEEEQERADEAQGVVDIEIPDDSVQLTGELNIFGHERPQLPPDPEVDALVSELEQIAVRTPKEKADDERAEAKARSEAEKVEIQQQREADKLRKRAEAERKKSSAEFDKLSKLLDKITVEDPAEKKRLADELRARAKDDERFWDGFGVTDMDVDDDTFYDEDGNFDEEKYDLYRDIVRESYAQQMKRLKASTRLLKRLRKDKTRIELPKLPGWQYLPGDRRIWTDPYAVSAEVAYPKDGFVSQGGPQSVFGFGR